jgi:hypothetical protein
MHLFIVGAICAIGGIIVGAIFHATFAEKAAASKKELEAFRLRLLTAFDSDTATAKTKVAAVISDIEKKL